QVVNTDSVNNEVQNTQKIRVMDELHLEQSALKKVQASDKSDAEVAELNENLERVLNLKASDQQIDMVLDIKLKGQEDNERVQKILKVVKDFRMFERLQNALEEDLSDIEKENLISFYSSPLVKKVKEAGEQNSIQPDLYEKMQDFIENYDSETVDQDRLALIQAINNKSGAEQVQKSQAMVLSQALTKSLLMAMSPDKSEQEVDGIVSKSLEAVSREFDRAYKPALYYSFNSLSKDELKDYLNLYSVHPQDLYADKFTNALKKIMDEFGETLGTSLRQD
ncbi:hypothetical protein, partial [Bacteriovorax sp. BSW11_IV]|uniref:hypothetical protein n=1 Tax=Bacteriovorax sp. BSW11_IV TaxID=1353529 RepID=UPI0018CA4042